MGSLNTTGWGHEPTYSAVELAEILQSHKPANKRLMPTEEQQAVIEAGPEPLLIVAGAGSGKTHTMTDRVVWLVANGFVTPEEVLGVTFTRKAAGELATRVTQSIERLAKHDGITFDLDPEDPGQPSVSTYHSYAQRLVKDHGLRIGIESDAELIGDAQAHQLIGDIVAGWDGDLHFTTLTADSIVSLVRSLASDAAEHLVTPEQIRQEVMEIQDFSEKLPVGGRGNGNKDTRDLEESLKLRTVMADMVAAYQELKRERNVMDYGDLVRYAQAVSTQVPEVGAIERSKYKVVLLDEFQDTSHAQLELFSGLFGAASGDDGVGHCVTAVGDPNQSIYGFRGASSGQLFAFPHEFPVVTRDEEGTITSHEPAGSLNLTTAWRNSSRILHAANSVIDRLNEPDQWIRGKGSSRHTVQKLQHAPGASEGEIVVNWFPDSETEAATIAEMLAERFATSAQNGEASQESAAILTRTRAAFTPIIEALDKKGVPYEVLGLSGLLQTPEIIEVVSCLRIIADPSDNKAMMRLLTNARWRIGAEDLLALNTLAKKRIRRRVVQRTEIVEPASVHDKFRRDMAQENAEQPSLLEALQHLPTDEDNEAARAEENLDANTAFSDVGLARLRELNALVTRLIQLRHLELPLLVRRIEKETGLEAELLARPGEEITSARRLTEAFLQVVEDFSSDTDLTSNSDLLGFLGWLVSAEAEERGLELPQAEPRPGAVQLLTVHSAKGLEWDVVVVPNLVEKTFPSNKASVWPARGEGVIPWSLRGDAKALPQWDWRSATTLVELAKSAYTATPEEKIDEVPPSLKDYTKEYYRKEELRLAYVAFTRPRNLLWVSGSHWSGRRTQAAEPSEFLTLLDELDGDVVTRGTFVSEDIEGEIPEANPRADVVYMAPWPWDPLDGPEIYQGTLDDYTHETLDDVVVELDERAEKLPARSHPRRQAMTQSAAQVQAHRGDVTQDITDKELQQRVQWAIHEDEFQAASDEVDLPRHLSTSAFIDLVSEPEELARQLRRPMPRKPFKQAQSGTIFHSWIEEHFGTNKVGATQMLDIEDTTVDADEFFDEALGVEELREKFLASEWAERSPAFVETAVETTIGDLTLRGRVDAIFRSGGDPDDPFAPDAQWQLVDWKTGMVPRNEAELNKRGLQLAVYRLAWSRLHKIPIENITGTFVYVAHGKDLSPHSLASEEELEKMLQDVLSEDDS